MDPTHKQIHPKELAGNILVGLGVAVWIPYLLSVSAEKHLSIAPFLGLHLALVLGGVRFKRTPQDRIASKRGLRQVIGVAMVIAGVLVWLPYLYAKHILGEHLDIAPYLVSHLSGVVVGGYLRISGSVAVTETHANQ